MAPPALRICAANSQSSGPLPGEHRRPSGTRPEDFSSVCAAPAVITPGSVQPGIGNGRSSAPVARMTRRADEHAGAAAERDADLEIAVETLQTVGAADELRRRSRRARATSSRPCQ